MLSAMTAAETSHRERAFEQVAEPLRRELKVHCYRMLGSLHGAEDLVQETYLRAWRGFDGFAGGSFRAWLYRIATNVCLDAIERRRYRQRLLPDQLAPASVQMPAGAPATEVAWLEPYPDSNLEGIADDAPSPEARYTSRQAIQLAFVAAIQQLPPRQRAVLLLCDVLGWAAAEVTTLLGGSTASINSALQRARATLAKRYPDGRPAAALRPDPSQQKLLDRYLHAWEAHDLESFVALLKEDAISMMPPWLEWYVGREAAGSLFVIAAQKWGSFRLVPSAANGQPAFAVYQRLDADARWAARGIHVLTLKDGLISALTTFIPPTGPRLFDAFGLPLTLAEGINAELLAGPQHF